MKGGKGGRKRKGSPRNAQPAGKQSAPVTKRAASSAPKKGSPRNRGFGGTSMSDDDSASHSDRSR